MAIQETADKDTYQPVKISFLEIDDFVKKNYGVEIVDSYKKNLEEIFLLRNPKYKFDPSYQEHLDEFINEHKLGKALEEVGNWFYFPWRKKIVHFFENDLHQELRTGRNKYLITKEEQEKYYGAVIGILGMSVGSHIALTIAMTGGSKKIKLADPDILSGDNLNRIRIGYPDVGTSKVILVARQIFEINPYAEIEIYELGLTEENADKFIEGLSVLIEEMDNPYFKIKIREKARSSKIPVIMGTDNGDGCIVDIERFDSNPEYPILHGMTGKLSAKDLKNLPPKELPRVAAKIAGANLAHSRMLHSVTEVGKSIYSWPQLGTAANLCGSVVAYLARHIILQDLKIKSGRYEVNLDSIFKHGHNSIFSKIERKKDFIKFIRNIKKRST